MMNLLISIKPEFVEKIISLDKKYEFRLSIFKRPVEKIFIYSTYPEKKIVGYFEFKELIKDSPINLWNKFSHVSGTTEEYFFKYFDGKEEGFAINIHNLNIFQTPIETSHIKNFRAPQSFCYIDEDSIFNQIKNKNNE